MRQPSVDSHDHDHHKVSADDPTVVSTEHSDSCHGHGHDQHHAVVRQPSVNSHDHGHHKVSADVPTTVQMSILIVVMVMMYTMQSPDNPLSILTIMIIKLALMIQQ